MTTLPRWNRFLELRASERRWLLAMIVIPFAVILFHQGLKSWSHGGDGLSERLPVLGRTLLVLPPSGTTEETGGNALRALALSVLVFAGFYFARVLPSRRWMIGYVLLAAGCLSNFCDAWIRHHAIDNLALLVGPDKYLPFNVADAAILSGAAVLLVGLARMLFEE